MPPKRNIFVISLFFFLGLVLVSSMGVSKALASYGYNMTGSTTGFTTAGTAPTCGSQAPQAPWLYSAVPLASAVDLFWAKVDNASSWTVAFGRKSGRYIYGLPDFGNSESRSVRISHLPAGTYYFVVRANNSCMPGPFSTERKVVVGMGSGMRLGTETMALQPTYQAPQYAPVITPYPTYVQPTQMLIPSPIPQRNYVPPRNVVTIPRPTPTPTPEAGLLQGLFNSLGQIFGL
jgi:hypothetical protein